MRLLTLALCASLATGRGKGGECDAKDHDKRVCDNNNKCICSNGRRRLSNYSAPTAAPTSGGVGDDSADVARDVRPRVLLG